MTEDHMALAVLIETLRAMELPISPQRVRLVAAVVQRPVLALAFLAPELRAEWLRLVGPEAQPLPANVVRLERFRKGGEDRPWADAVALLKAGGHLREDRESGDWSTPSPLEPTDEPWLVGRVGAVLPSLMQIELPSAEQRIADFVHEVEDGRARLAVS